MRLKLLHHDRCFDGAASAALFSRFYRDKIDSSATIVLQGLTHRPGGAFDQSVLDGDANAIVDFRYSGSPKLTWWFDHHVSAFSSPDDEQHFRADTSGRKHFDPAARSCTKFMARVLRERFGWTADDREELIEWAELIDGALFASARQAVELAEPALQIMTTLEVTHDPRLIPRIIGDMQTRSLPEIASDPYIAEPFARLFEAHWATREKIRQVAREEEGVVVFDLGDENVEGFNKFIAYELHPEARYTVGITKTRARTKVSVGSNPWSKVPRTHDIAALCGRYGGGGHPVVGAVSFGPGEIDRARQVAAEIASVLRS